MKNRLKEWAESNDVKKVAIFFDRFIDTSDGAVRFRNCEDYDTVIQIKGWPTGGLKDCEEYSIEDLDDKANKE
jgi:hypothetical protein